MKNLFCTYVKKIVHLARAGTKKNSTKARNSSRHAQWCRFFQIISLNTSPRPSILLEYDKHPCLGRSSQTRKNDVVDESAAYPTTYVYPKTSDGFMRPRLRRTGTAQDLRQPARRNGKARGSKERTDERGERASGIVAGAHRRAQYTSSRDSGPLTPLASANTLVRRQ